MSPRRSRTGNLSLIGPVSLVILALALVFSGAVVAVQGPRDRGTLPFPQGVTIPPRPTVRFAPDPIQAGLGQVTYVDVVVENAVGLYAAEIRIAYPGNLTQIQDAYPLISGVQVQQGNIFDGFDTYTIQNRVDSGANLIEYIVSITGSPVGVTGAGTIATIPLYGQGLGSGLLSFVDVILCERSGTSMVVNLPNEQVSISVVGQTATPTQTLVPSATNTKTPVFSPTYTATLHPSLTVTSTATSTLTPTASATVSTTTTIPPSQTPTPTQTGVLYTPTPVCTNLIQNGSFETIVASSAPPWVKTGATTFTSVEHRSGVYSAWLGGYNGANDGLYQDFSIPGHAQPGEQLTQAVLRYSWGMFTEELSHPFDFMRVNLRDQTGALVQQIEEITDGSVSGPWQDREVDLSAYEGQSLRVSFEVNADGTNVTSFYVDDVSLEICEIFMPTPTATSAITDTATATPTVTGTVTIMPTHTSTPIIVTEPVTTTLQQKDGVYAGSEDSYISAWDSPPANYGAQGAMSIRTSGVKRPLLRFELPPEMSGATVIRATLSLYTSHYKSHAQDMSVSIYGLSKRFAEMSVTWPNAAASTPWDTAGADGVGVDRDADAQDTVAVSTINTWYAFDVTDLVKSWADGTRPNDGMILIASGNTVEMSFWSSEYSLPDLRPKLIIQYAYGSQPPTPSATPQFSPTPGPSPTPTLTATAVAAGTTVTFQQDLLGYQGVYDTYLSNWQPDTNYGGSVTLLVRQGDVRTTLVRFADLNLPANAVIHEAKLQLYAVDRSNSGNLTVDAYAVLKSWMEDQATWNLSRVGTPWGLSGCNLTTDPGGDRRGAAISTRVVNDIDQWFEWDVTPVVREWSSGQLPNRGIVLKGNGMTSVEYLFASSEYWWGQQYTPRLVIRYSVS